MISGPIKKDRAFYMFNYEGNKVRRVENALSRVPSLKEITGDFSESSRPLIDPLTRLPFPGNVIPANRIDSVGRNISAYYPDPNRVLGAGSNYLSNIKGTTDFYITTSKVDYRVSDKQNVFVRFTWQNAFEFFPGLVPNGGGARFQPIGRNVAISDTYVFGPRVVNEFRVGFNRLLGCTCAAWMRPGKKSTTRNYTKELGIKGVQSVDTPDPTGYGFAWPSVTITGYAPVSAGGSQTRHDDTWHFFDMLAVTRGNHQMKMGGEVRTTMLNIGTTGNNGTFAFDGRYTGNAFADLLLGYPSQTGRSTGDDHTYTRGRAVNLFFQNDWRVSSRLTLNLGVRWEFMSPYADAVYGQAVWDVPSGQIVIVGRKGQQTYRNPITGATIIVPGGVDYGRKSLYNKDLNNYAPRFGFAWSPQALSIVVRGGYGIFTVPDFNRHAYSYRSTTFPWVIPQTFNGDPTRPNISLQNPFPDALAQSTITARAFDPDYRNGYTQQWTLGIQRPLGANMVLDVSYAGSRGTKWLGLRNINQPLPGPGSVASRRPIQGWGNILQSERGFGSKFHSLQSKFERRFSDGLTFVSAYTWSHGMTDQEEGSTGSGSLQDSYNLKVEWGNAVFDIRHRLVNSFSYELPFGPHKPLASGISGLAGALIGGWQIAGIATLSTGQAVTPEVSGDIAQIGGTTVRPNRIADGRLTRSQRSPTRWFDTSAFVIPATGTFGNSGRTILNAPGINNWDLTLMKNTRIGENRKLEFRAEFFDAFNRASFMLPVLTVNSPQFGTLTQARDARQIQFGLKLHY